MIERNMLKKIWSKICFWRKDKNNKHSPSCEKDVYQDIADVYLKNNLINSRLIPDILETRIYGWIISKVFDLLQDTLHELEYNVFHQKMSIDVSFIEPNTFLANLTAYKKTHPFEKMRQRQNKQMDKLCNDFIDVFVRQVHQENDQVISLPMHFQKLLYRNIFMLMMGIVQDTMCMTQIRILCFNFHMTCFQDQNAYTPMDSAAFQQRISELHTFEKAREKSQSIIDSDNNIWYIPNVIEKRLYQHAFMFMYFCMYVFAMHSRVSIWNMLLKVNVSTLDENEKKEEL